MTFDVENIRKRFPSLQRSVGGREPVFADAPGGTQVPALVVDAMVGYLSTSNANEGGAFATSRETDEVITAAREAAADLLACDPSEVVFGANMTTLAFALSRSLARDLQPGDEVVVTRLDHDGNVAPWVAAAEDSGAVVRRIDIRDEDCTLDPMSLDEVIGPKTRIVAFTLASNAVGTIPDASEVVRRARSVGALVIADAVHFAPHRIIDVGALGVDVLFCSPYKFFGPHMGVMYASRRLLDGRTPYKVRPASNESPARWETGTRNHEALAGFVACVEHLATLTSSEGSRRARLERSMEDVQRHEEELSRVFLEGIASLEGFDLFGIADNGRIGERTPTFALRCAHLSPRRAAEHLGEQGIFVWDGNYYAIELMERLGLEGPGGAVRIGFCHYHAREDVERVVDGLSRMS